MRKLFYLIALIFIIPFIVNAQTIIGGEYYLDNDQGLGTGIPFTLVAGDSLNIIDSVNISGLTQGLHWLCIRYIDDLGNWSFPECKPFYFIDSTLIFEPPVSKPIIAGEYYIDTDQGEGTGFPFTIIQDDTLNILDSINISGLTTGIHWLCIRYKDEDNNWSFPECKPFYFIDSTLIFEPPVSKSIVAAEYYIDSDQGNGTGIPITIVQNDTLNIMDSINISGLTQGIHWLCIRFMDEDNNWSFPECKSFYFIDSTLIFEPPVSKPIIAAEYYFDLDEGIGTGVQLQISSDDSLNILDSINVSGLTQGIHWLCIRFMDEDNNWSFPECKPFYFYDSSYITNKIPSPPIISGEYFFGNDPGQGNGSPFFFEQADTLNILQSISANGLGNGDYFLTIRFKDSLNNWSFNETLPFTVASVPELLYPDYDSTDVPLNPTLVWRPFTGASSYNVQLSNNANFTTTIINQSVSDTTLFVSTNLNYDTHYYWRANCVIGGSASVWSSVFRFKTRRNVETPRLISPNNLSTQVATAPKFIWSKSDSSLTYNLLLSTSPLFETTVIDEAGIIDTLFESTILQSFTTYYWKILGVGANNTSYWSTAWQFETGDSSGFMGTPKILQVQLAMHGLWDGQSHKKAPLQVELRQGDSLMNSVVISRKSAIINEEGIIEINFAEIDTGDYWLIVRSGGYLSLGSTSKVNISTNGFFYDFSDNPYKSAGGIYAVIQSGDGKWCMRAGDFNADRKTNAAEDFEFYIKPNSGKNISNYVPEP